MNSFDYSVNSASSSSSVAATAGNMGGGAVPEKGQLWRLMLELGYASCEPNTLRDLYSHLIYDNPGFVLRESDIAAALGMMMCSPLTTTTTTSASTAASGGSSGKKTSDLTDPSQGWDVESFVVVVKEIAPKLDWNLVLKDLDFPEFYLKDIKGFELLVRAFRRAATDFVSFPIKHLISPWKNLRGQLSLIRQAVLMPLDVFSFSMFPCRRLFTPEDLSACLPNYKATMLGLFQQNWNCLDLLEYLISLFDTEYHEIVRPLLEMATRQSPELFCLGLASFPNWSGISLRDTLIKLVCGFLMGHNNCALILPKLWSINPNIVLACMVDLYRKDPSCLSRILDVAQDLKILNLILDSKPGSFSLDVAALASRREHLNLEKWVVDSIMLKKEAFVRPCLEFLKERIRLMLERQEGKLSVPFIPLSSEILLTFTHCILSNPNESSIESQEICRELQNVITGNSSAPSTNAVNQSQECRGAPIQQLEINFPPDIEEEVNSYYERIYRHEFEIKDIIELFSSMKSSKNPRDQQVFACMIHNLFDEYQYFHGYPDKELNLTAIIFGVLIQYQLISFVPLGMALRCVIDSLKKPPHSKLFKFGLQAIHQFRPRLIEWPQYCSHLLQIPHLVQVQPELAAYLKQCLLSATHSFAGASYPAAGVGMSLMNNSAPAVLSSGTFASNLPAANLNVACGVSPGIVAGTMPSEIPRQITEEEKEALNPALLSKLAASTGQTGAGTSRQFSVENTFSSVNINVLLDSMNNIDMQRPENAFQDKISFIMNNISVNNIESKTAEFCDLFKDCSIFYEWFAFYLVIRRASIEPNFHDLYIQLLENIVPGSKELFTLVLQKTLLAVDILIGSEKTLSSSSDRMLLKNLGVWLGCLTLARNKPILQKDMCLKRILIIGYEEDKLIVVIPFVCKILDQSVKSTVFVPYNPWLMSILRILCELYYSADLKLTLKFEIELLYKHLKLELNSIEPTAFFKNKMIKKRMASYLGDKKGVCDLSSSLGGIVSSPFSPRMPATDDKNLGISALASYVLFNPNISILQSSSLLCKLILFAIDFGIREVAGPVIKRSLYIASATTAILISKDFDKPASQYGPDKKITCAKNMIQNIVGNLVQVTSREPLRASIATNIINFLKIAGVENLLSIAVVQSIVDDNIDLCLAFIERTAIEKSIGEIENHPTLISETASYHSESAMNIPVDLTFTPKEIATTYSKVYDEFIRVSRLQNLSSLPLTGPIPPVTPEDQECLLNFLKTFSLTKSDSAEISSAPVVNATVSAGSEALLRTGNTLSIQQCMDRFMTLFSSIESFVATGISPTTTFASLSSASEVRILMKQIILLAYNSLHKDEVCMLFLHKIVQFLYKSTVENKPFLIEICVLMIEKLCEISTKSAKEVTTWFIYSEDERKFDFKVTTAILQTGLVSLMEYDLQLAKFIEANRPENIIEFASSLLNACCLKKSIYVADSRDTKSNTSDSAHDGDSIPAASFSNFSAADFTSTIEALNEKIASKSSSVPSSTVKLMEKINSIKAESINDAKTQVTYFFADWMKLCMNSSENEQLIHTFVNYLFQQSLRISTESVELFIKSCVECSIEIYAKQRKVPSANAFLSVDSLAKLSVSLLKHFPADYSLMKKTEMFACFLENIGIYLCQLCENTPAVNAGSIQRPFSRLLQMILRELNQFLPVNVVGARSSSSPLESSLPNSNVSTVNLQSSTVLSSDLLTVAYELYSAFGQFLLEIQPSFVPSFTFAWFEIASCKYFTPFILNFPQPIKQQALWNMYSSILESVFRFLHKIPENGEFINTLYRGILRSLLVLLHDYPEFLSFYYVSLCDALPMKCSQFRNLILSAFPRNLKLPDPFTLSVKIDEIPESSSVPAIFVGWKANLTSVINLISDCKDEDVKSIVDLLKQHLLQDYAGSRLKLHALVIYSGYLSVSTKKSVHMRILQCLITECDPEVRYCLLNCIVNQLRFPSVFTTLFSKLVLSIFDEAPHAQIKEQIVRVILERLVVNRPHPWGLLVTFIELIKNPAHGLWSQSFIKIAPEIERLFNSVARSCLASSAPNAPQPSAAAQGPSASSHFT